MHNLLAAGAVVGACHHRGEQMPADYGGSANAGIDPVPAPAIVPRPMELTVETAWLNARQLVVHVVAKSDVGVVSVESSAGAALVTSGTVPHLPPERPAWETPTPPGEPPAGARRPVTVVFDDALGTPRERWLILRDAGPDQEILMHVWPATSSPELPVVVALRMPAALGEIVSVGIVQSG